MSRLGLIRNPRSTRNRRQPAPTVPSGVLHAAPETLDELRAVLQGYARQEVDLIAISGGDGTIRDVLTALRPAYGDTLPRIALLASGNTNLIAGDVGTAGIGDEALAQLAVASRMNRYSRIETRPLLQLDRAGFAPVLGGFMGAAALSRATRYAHEQVLSRGHAHGTSVALTLLGVLSQTLRGSQGWLSGGLMTVEPEGQAPIQGPRFLFLATTLRKLTFGLWPFWGNGGEVRYLDIEAPPQQLLRNLLPLARGRPTESMLARGYRSGAVNRLRIRSDEPVIVDGEAFEPGSDGIFTIGLGPRLEFVTP